MPRLFVALSIPEPIADAMLMLQSGVEGARWRTVDHFHITLAFIGDVEGLAAREAADALNAIDAPGFDVQLSAVGSFGDKKPRALWAGVSPAPALLHLQQKVEANLRRVGFQLERRKFTPHVTLAYLKGARRDVVATWRAHHGLFSTPAFSVGAFHLYQSHLGSEQSAYEIVQSYSLSSSM